MLISDLHCTPTSDQTHEDGFHAGARMKDAVAVLHEHRIILIRGVAMEEEQ